MGLAGVSTDGDAMAVTSWMARPLAWWWCLLNFFSRLLNAGFRFVLIAVALGEKDAVAERCLYKGC
jgi:hypothetical protein